MKNNLQYYCSCNLGLYAIGPLIVWLGVREVLTSPFVTNDKIFYHFVLIVQKIQNTVESCSC